MSEVGDLSGILECSMVTPVCNAKLEAHGNWLGMTTNSANDNSKHNGLRSSCSICICLGYI